MGDSSRLNAVSDLCSFQSGRHSASFCTQARTIAFYPSHSTTRSDIGHEHVHRQPLAQHVQQLPFIASPHTNPPCHDTLLLALHLSQQRLRFQRKLLRLTQPPSTHSVLLQVLDPPLVVLPAFKQGVLAPQSDGGVVHREEDDVGETELELIASEEMVQGVAVKERRWRGFRIC